MRFLFLLFVSLLPITLTAQQKGWQEITISDGLSQGMIFGLKQDKKGFIWVATKDGLNRYDGHNFTVFTHDPANEYSLSANYCSALLVDKRGRLWIGTLNNGLNLFDDRTQRFYHISIHGQATVNAGNYEIQLLTEDPQGNIWVSTNQGKLVKITLPNSLKTDFPDKADFTDQVQAQLITIPQIGVTGAINHISFQPGGQSLIGSSFNLYTLNWHRPQEATRVIGVAEKFTEFFSTYYDAQHDCWIASTSDQIICLKQDRIKTIPLPRKGYSSVYLKAIDANTLAITTTDFLWVMPPSELEKQDSLTARNAFVAMPPAVYAITDLLKDQTGNIWAGTSGYGLRKFNPKIRQFHSSLPNTTLSFLYVDQQGRTYVRHEFAYEQLDRSTNRLKSFLPNELPPADKRQRYMMQDRQATFWVSNTNFQTHAMHLFKFSADWKLLKKYPLPTNTSFGFYTNQTIKDKDGMLWIAALNGILLQFDPKTETFRTFSFQRLLPQKGAEIDTQTLYLDQAGTLWIGTTNGLIRAVHLQTNPVFSQYKNNAANAQSLSNDMVSSLLDDPYQPNRYLWVGTKGGGLDRLDKQTGQFEHFTEAQGLPNKVVYGILADEFRNLWLSTNRGLAQFNLKTHQFHNYTKEDGLQDDEFNTGSFFISASGELLFGGVNGLTIFKPSAVKPLIGPQPLANIINLKVNNETVKVRAPDGILAQGIEYTQRLDLSHNQNLLTFEFGVMDYTNSAKNRYRYRLDGIDKIWVEAGTNRFANYAQLPAGNYTLQMIGSPDGEVWSKPVDLHIRIHPPFYRTWWAYLLYALVLIIISWQLYTFQKQRWLLQQQVIFEKQEAGRLAELDGLKTKFFANISHEFRTPLTLILGPLADLKQRFPTETVLGLMERNGNRLLSLINQLLDLSKLEAGQLKAEPESGDVASFFQMLASSFSSLAESRQISFTFSQNKSEHWASFDRDKLEKIVTNLLANAFKFTPAGKEVRMQVHYPDSTTTGTLRFSIEDTGIGINKKDLPHIFERFYQRSAVAVPEEPTRSYEGTGIGLALVNELVKMLDGTIQVTSTEEIGTTFTVTLPLLIVSSEGPSPRSVRTQTDLITQFHQQPIETQAEDVKTLAPISENILLVIDDNADIRAYVRSIFETDYHVIEAVDGQDGLEKATALLPNIVICDLMMPQLDGFGFCRTLKTQPATSHIPVVMLTAKATVEDRIEGFELGADDYLTKPFNRAEIQARVRNLVEQRQRLQTWFSTNWSEPTDHLQLPTPFTAEQQFIERLSALVIQHLDDTQFTVEDLAEAANLSRAQLHRKLKALANTSATTFIRDIRLRKATELLNEGQLSVTQTAYAVGFDNLSYFAKVFQERYGVLPSQYGKSAPQPS
ncbi:hybrid sensor histidine kinase/response regulator transcription factor [Spirosoma foliorum]|uniref:histidine kinase n=1 Tax=Spirosoma foliorum TaxID=2710596 RepID=A0A7G5H1V7_9BACT|nr:ATP-binding protein [Spirosoma foliorum]QMW05099.1 response regulator [Spirosoma foliorum]